MEDSNIQKLLTADCSQEKWISLVTKRNPQLVDSVLRALRASARTDANVLTGVWESETWYRYNANGRVVTSHVTSDESSCRIAVRHAVYHETVVLSLPAINGVSLEACRRAVGQPSAVPVAVQIEDMIEVAQVLVNRASLHFPSIDSQLHVVCELQWRASCREQVEEMFVTSPPSACVVRLLLTRQGGMTAELLAQVLTQLCNTLEVSSEDEGCSPDIQQHAQRDDADLVQKRKARTPDTVAREA